MDTPGSAYHPAARRQYLADVEAPNFGQQNAPMQYHDSYSLNPYTTHPVMSEGPSEQWGRQFSHDSQSTIVDPAYPPAAMTTGDLNRQYLRGKDVNDGTASVKAVPLVRPRARKGIVALVPEISLERTFFYALWVIMQLAIFVPTCLYYITTDDYKTTRGIMGPTLGVSRGAAMTINFDASIILLLVSRNFLSYLRSTFVSRYITIDKNIHAHKVVAWSLMFMVFVHVFGHCFNLSKLANHLKAPGVTFAYLFFASPVGLTGTICTVVMIIMFATATAAVRRKNFELFYYTHHLFIVFYGSLIAHGMFCVIKADNEPVCRGHPDFWKWFLIPGLVYVAERISREIRGRQPTQISRVIQHPSRVVQIQIKKANVKVKTGQYIYICCPEISRGQWHPFTLTSAPEDDFISIHMRMAGDWTRQFAERLGCDSGAKKGTAPTKRFNPLRSKTIRRGGGRGNNKPADPPAPSTTEETNSALGLPRIMVDGPFGAPTEHVFDYEVSVLVGAGIGVTPFASVLKSLWYRISQPGKLSKTNKVYFFWICRDIQAFEWFQDLLVALEEEELGQFLDVRAYLTGRLSEDQIRNLSIHTSEDGPDALTGRKNPTFFGRPNFDQIFAEIAAEQLKKKVGVFFCGPKPIATNLQRICRRYSSSPDSNGLSTGTQFEFHKEHF
ncbi:hypothetical protein H4R33_001949 [Dimargaris cristalligena]|nr:hypothetical protein H4R33_001949 [Dimargaris cristalligena]